nr:universal stress protein [Streptomyces sp. NBC_01001]
MVRSRPTAGDRDRDHRGRRTDHVLLAGTGRQVLAGAAGRRRSGARPRQEAVARRARRPEGVPDVCGPRVRRETVEVVDEKPAQALLDAAERHRARVIIVGSWGDSPIRGALLGSTPHKLLHLSPVPVLCVPTRGDTAE